jgi:hypothetical protein
MSPPEVCKAVPRLTLALMAGAALLASSCAAEPPPRPVRLDPANPGAPESRPLETSAPGAAEHAGHRPAAAPPAARQEPVPEGGTDGGPEHEHQHAHGAGGSP